MPYIIGIAGGSASGKTFLLKSLREIFPENELCIVSQDDYYKPIEQQARDKNGEVNFDLPTGIDAGAFLHDVKLLANGKEISRKEYTFNNPGKKPSILVFKPAPVIVVEGLFLFYFQEISAMLNLKIFIDANEDIKLNRRVERDMKERGRAQESIIYQWGNHVKPAYQNYLKPYRDRADIIITNNYSINHALKTIANHIRAKL